MARIRQIVDAINRVPLQEVDTRTPEQIQADYEYARNMHAPAGIRKKETPVNIPRQTDTQIKVGFKPSMG